MVDGIDVVAKKRAPLEPLSSRRAKWAHQRQFVAVDTRLVQVRFADAFRREVAAVLDALQFPRRFQEVDENHLFCSLHGNGHVDGAASASLSVFMVRALQVLLQFD